MLGGQPQCELRSWEMFKEPVSVLPSLHLPHTHPVPQFIGPATFPSCHACCSSVQPASSQHTWVKEALTTVSLTQQEWSVLPWPLRASLAFMTTSQSHS